MAVVTQIPTPSQPLTGEKGLVTTPWFQFFMHVFNTVSPGGGPAPANTGYVVTSADPSLPNSRVATSSATVTVNVATPGVMKWDAVGGGTGDVVGPASAVDDRIATFDGVTGKLIQDGGKTIATVVSDAVTAATAAILPVHILTETTGFPGGTTTFLRADATFATPAGGGDVSGPGAAVVDDRIATWDGVSGTLIQDGGKTIATVVSDAVTAAVAAIVPVDLASEVTGDLPLANLAQASAASRLLGRGSAGGAGDWQEVTLGANLTMTGTVLAATGGGTGDVVGPASAVNASIATYNGTTGKLIQDGGKTIATVVSDAVTAATSAVLPIDLASEVTGTLPVANVATLPSAGLSIVIDGGGVAITTGVKVDVEMPFAGTFTAVRLFADQTGSLVLDLWKDTYVNFPPVVGDSITASAKPTLSAAAKSQDTTLTGWTTSFSAGDILRVNVDSASTVTRVTLALRYMRT